MSKLKTTHMNENKEAIRCGCPLYMAPELFWKETSLRTIESQKVDIWALGVMAFEMFFGRKPFEAQSLKELYKIIKKGEYYLNFKGRPNNKISKEFVEFLNLCLQQSSKERVDVFDLQNTGFYNKSYQSFTEMNKDELLISLGNPGTKGHLVLLRIDKKYYEQYNEEDGEDEE